LAQNEEPRLPRRNSDYIKDRLSDVCWDVVTSPNGLRVPRPRTVPGCRRDPMNDRNNAQQSGS
jgi:hypothetical protein